MKLEICEDVNLIEKFLRDNFSSPTHWPRWNIIVSKCYMSDFFYFVIKVDDQLVGICPIHINTKWILKEYYSGQYNYIPYGGWLFSEKFPFHQVFYQNMMINCLKIHSLPQLHDFNVDYEQLVNFKKQYTLIVELNSDLDDIWRKQVDGKRRNMIRKAEKNGIEIQIWDSTKLDAFYNFYDLINTQYGLENMSLNYFSELLEKSDDFCTDILVALKNGEILSSIVIIYDKNYAIFFLGHNDKSKEQLGQSELLQWEAIKKLKEYGCKYYDMAMVDKVKLPKIYEFKKGFAKIEVPVYFINDKSFSFRLLNRIVRFFYPLAEGNQNQGDEVA